MDHYMGVDKMLVRVYIELAFEILGELEMNI
jgi:hypothetical protein